MRAVLKPFLMIFVIFFFYNSCLVYSQYRIISENKNNCGLCIDSVLIRHYCTNDFVRISEFFTGRENTGGATIVRTDELARGGIYLVVKLNRSLCELSADSKLVFQYVLSDCKLVQKKTFDLRAVAGTNPWLFIGVTGPQYHGRGQTILAWHIEISSENESVCEESYLWEMNCGNTEVGTDASVAASVL